MKELNNEVEINASAERVWHLLTDFAQFPQWNPFIQRVSGEPTAGARLDVTIQPSGTGATTIRPIVLKAEPNRELRWHGQWLTPGLLDDERAGIVPNVVFPTGIDLRENGRVDIYYGMADAAIGVARLDIPARLDEL